MCRIILFAAICFPAICQYLQIRTPSAIAKLTNQERAIVYVIGEEARDYALEARDDVCVDFDTHSSVRESKIFAALREKGLRFHPASWCNRGPKGVDISITIPSKEMPPGTFEILSSIGDSDPIRLYGEHFATLLRRIDYVVKCKDDAEPMLESQNLTCCEKTKLQTPQSPK